MNTTSKGIVAINFSFEKHEIIILSLLLTLAFMVRVVLFPIPGYRIDLDTFTSWINTAVQHGPRVFYNIVAWSDYPPLNIYIFWGLGSIANAFSLSGTTQMSYLIKHLPSLFDIATITVIFMYLRNRINFKTSLLVSVLYAFNPAIIINSAIWGQLDAIYTFFLLFSLVLVLDSKPKLSAVFLVLGLLTKPQSIAIAPLILFLIFKKQNWKTFVKSLLAGVGTLFAVIIPFEWSNPLVFLSNIYLGAYQGYAYTTVNAFNLWALGGLWVRETAFLFIIGWTLFGALVVFALFVLHKRFSISGELLAIFIAFILFLGFFMLPTRIHERYLFPALSVLALTFPFLKKMRPTYIILSATFFINQAYVLYYLNLGTFISAGDPVVLGVSLINLMVLLYVLILLWDEFKGHPWFMSKSAKIDSDKKQG
jgi:Gpi18-like mannosyltransferase